MKKKLFLKFFVLAVIGAFVTFTSCKDYDDDISGLKTELNALKADVVKKSELEALKTSLETKISALEAKMATKDDLALYVKLETYNAFKTSVEAEIAALKAGLEKAATKEEVAAIEASLKSDINAVKMDLLAKISNIEAILDIVGDESGVINDIKQQLLDQLALINANKADIVDIKQQLEDQLALINQNKADIETINGKIDGIMARLDGIDAEITNIWKELTNVKNLLRSMVLIPHHYVNGIEAIGFNPIAYDHCTKETTQLANPKYVTVSYILNPSTVKESDIDKANLSFLYQLKENKFKSAGINAKANFVSLKGDTLTVKVLIDANYAETTAGGTYAAGYYIEQFDMVALQVPLLGAGAGEVITSEWARIDVDAKDNVQIDRVGKLCETDNTTYSEDYSTVAAAKAETTPYLLELVYNKQHNLLDYVTSTADLFGDCDEFDPADYGLVWNFDLKDENGVVFKYLLDSNETDQQEFIKLTGNQGIIDSKVYDTSGTDAIGRTPIVRVQIIDPATKCVVSQGFVKIKWVKENPVFDATYPAQKVDFDCGVLEHENEGAPLTSAIGFEVKTQWMNVNVYNKMGTFYKEFYHNNKLDEFNIYDEDGEPVDWGYVIGNPDTQEGENEVTDLFEVYLSDVCQLEEATKFEGYVHYVAKMDNDIVTVRVKVTLDVNMPKLGITGYNQTYWQGGNASSNQFNVNPIVYGTASQTANVTGNTNNNGATALVFTDLLNGFVDKNLKYTDDINNIITSSINGYAPCDVKIVFDRSKLDAYFGVGKWSVDVDADGNEQLSLGGVLAAGIRFLAQADVPGATHDGYYIGLAESNQFTGGGVPTSAAKSLIGREVPVRIVANLCCESECEFPTVIKSYDVHFMVPLKINSDFVGEFEDGVVNGDSLSVDGAFTLTDWRDYLVANVADNTVDPGKEKQKYTESLYKYYVVQTPVWDLTKVKCNLAGSGSNLDVVPGAKNDLPTNYQLAYDGTTNSLVFFNNSGTPLQKDFELYVPVSVGYKWGTLTSTVTIKVKGI